MSRRCRCVLLVALALLLPGCVVGSARRPRQAEAASGPPPEPQRDRSAAQVLLSQSTPRAAPDAPSASPGPDFVWVSGYWHWNGARYVWVPGRWERSPAPTAD